MMKLRVTNRADTANYDSYRYSLGALKEEPHEFFSYGSAYTAALIHSMCLGLELTYCPIKVSPKYISCDDMIAMYKNRAVAVLPITIYGVKYHEGDFDMTDMFD